MGKLLRITRRPARFAFTRWLEPVGNRCKGVVMLCSGAIEAETEVGPYWLVDQALREHFAGLPRVEDPEAARDRRAFNAAMRRGGAACTR